MQRIAAIVAKSVESAEGKAKAKEQFIDVWDRMGVHVDLFDCYEYVIKYQRIEKDLQAKHMFVSALTTQYLHVRYR